MNNGANDSFRISKHEPIAVYGGGITGLGVTNSLIRAGYNAVCILDRNPAGVENSPVPVISPEEAYEIFGDIFTFISIASVECHMQVAMTLNAIGFKKLLLLSLFLRSSAAKAMIKAYNFFLAGEYDVYLPCFDDLWKISADDYLLTEDLSFATAVVHKRHVYTTRMTTHERNPLVFYTHVPKHQLLEYDLFCHSYGYFFDTSIDILRTDPKLRESFLEFTPFRDGVLPMWEGLLFSPPEFFTEMAMPAELNTKGYFNILDGHHRAIFLLDKGLSGLPLRISKTEWEAYFRETQAQALMDYCKNLGTLPFAVNHPAFIRLPVKKREPDGEFLRLFKDLYTENRKYYEV